MVVMVLVVCVVAVVLSLKIGVKWFHSKEALESFACFVSFSFVHLIRREGFNLNLPLIHCHRTIHPTSLSILFNALSTLLLLHFLFSRINYH